MANRPEWKGRLAQVRSWASAQRPGLDWCWLPSGQMCHRSHQVSPRPRTSLTISAPLSIGIPPILKASAHLRPQTSFPIAAEGLVSLLSPLGPWLSLPSSPTHPGYGQTNTHPALRKERAREMCTHDSLVPFSGVSQRLGSPRESYSHSYYLFSEPRQLRIKI